MPQRRHHKVAASKASASTYGEGTTYPDKDRPGRWFAKFPLGNGATKTRRFASEQAGDAWRER